MGVSRNCPFTQSDLACDSLTIRWAALQSQHKILPPSSSIRKNQATNKMCMETKKMCMCRAWHLCRVWGGVSTFDDVFELQWAVGCDHSGCDCYTVDSSIRLVNTLRDRTLFVCEAYFWPQNFSVVSGRSGFLTLLRVNSLAISPAVFAFLGL